MNYFNLLARGLLMLYSGFLLLFAVGEDAGGEGIIRALAALTILFMMVLLKDKPVLCFLFFMVTFVASVWFFRTYQHIALFATLSLPLGLSGVLFLFGKYYAPVKPG